MLDYIKKFKSFWFVELLLLGAGFYIIYDGFVADDARYSLSSVARTEAPAQKSASSEPAPAQMNETILETGVVCLDVDAKKKKPLMAKGRFSKYIDKLYCFTEISGLIPNELIHDWVYEDEPPVRRRIKLNGTETKVWSEMAMSPEKAGSWRVDIRTGDGQFLYSANFVLK